MMDGWMMGSGRRKEEGEYDLRVGRVGTVVPPNTKLTARSRREISQLSRQPGFLRMVTWRTCYCTRSKAKVPIH